jgi:hypothetical protein
MFYQVHVVIRFMPFGPPSNAISQEIAPPRGAEADSPRDPARQHQEEDVPEIPAQVDRQVEFL